MGKKGYVWKIEPSKKEKGYHNDFIFSDSAEGAWHWTTLESAEYACADMNRGVTIENKQGEKIVCTDFTVEKIGPDYFVISCEWPLA